jgi:hypothetical protein
MVLTPSIPELPVDVRVMLDAAIRHAQTGKGDPALLQRIHDEAEKIKREVFEKHDLFNLGTPAIRELRDE